MGKDSCMVVMAVILALSSPGHAEDEPARYSYGGMECDPREIPWLIEDTADISELDPPSSIDHSSDMPPVGHQGTQPSCVAWATAYYYKTYQEWVEHGWDVEDPANQFSPAFMYNQINNGIRGPTYISDAMKVLIDHGCANILDCPYDEYNYTTWPAESAYHNAIPFRCEEYFWRYCSDNTGILALKQHIADGDNAILGIFCYDNFQNINQFNNVYCVSEISGDPDSHFVCLVGYDDNKMTNDGPGAFRLVNSWGVGWGDQGYFWMSYTAVKNPLTSRRRYYYATDRENYTPAIEVRLKISHDIRESINMSVGIGANDSWQWLKDFHNWYIETINPPGSHPFPDSKIVLDISDGFGYLNPYDANNIFVECQDNEQDGTTGTIDTFLSVCNEWSAFSQSLETPASIPDYGRADVNLTMPTQTLHWPCFQRLPSHAGITDLTGNLNRIDRLWRYAVQPEWPARSPVLGDIDDDGKIEVVYGYIGLHALNGEDGSVLWTYSVSNPYPQPVHDAPALGDIDGDGRLEVVCTHDDGEIYALNGEDGSLLWSEDINCWAFSHGGVMHGDIDGDGFLEVLCSSSDGLYALNGEDGSLVWLHPTVQSLWTSPALGDINADGYVEVVVGMDDALRALNGVDGSVLWSYPPSGNLDASSPSIGDLDGDERLEVAFCSEETLYAVNGEDGSFVWSYPLYGYHYHTAAPVLGDIDDDGKIEVVCGAGNWSLNWCRVYAVNGEDGSYLWSYEIDAHDQIWPAQALGDIDGDGRLEVVISSEDAKVCALNGEDGLPVWSYTLDARNVYSSPALGDIDGDGDLEVVCGCDRGRLYALGPVHEATVYVHPDSPVNTIQKGLDNATPYDLVIVAPGSYNENISWPDKPGVKLMSEFGRHLTVIDGGDSACITVSVNVDTMTIIRGFTVLNGFAAQGNIGSSESEAYVHTKSPYRGTASCITCSNGASPIVDSCIIVSKIADGIHCEDGASPVISYNDIAGNFGYGVQNADSDVIVNAENNWWGHMTGPSGAGPGMGDSVSEYVDYDPWLTSSMSDSVAPATPYVFSTKAGNDVELTWNMITTDTLGNAESVDYYVIYRSTSPSFVPGSVDSIGAVFQPETTYTDVNALIAGSDYYYLVKAVDLKKNVSKKSNMAFLFIRGVNESPMATDRPWPSMPW